MTYIMLSGTPPFYDDKPDKLKHRITNDELKFPQSQWSNISHEAKDFIKICLVKDRHKRAHVKDLLEHSWIKKSQEKDLKTETKL